jgi:hypothetical protein
VRFILKILGVQVVGEEEDVRGEVPLEDSRGSSCFGRVGNGA